MRILIQYTLGHCSLSLLPLSCYEMSHQVSVLDNLSHSIFKMLTILLPHSCRIFCTEENAFEAGMIPIQQRNEADFRKCKQLARGCTAMKRRNFISDFKSRALFSSTYYFFCFNRGAKETSQYQP